MPINIEKIQKELSKGTPYEQYEAYLKVKEFVQVALEAEREEVEKKNNEILSKIERLSGNNY